MRKCDKCDGHGEKLHWFTGEPEDCPKCGGSGVLMTKDESIEYRRAAERLQRIMEEDHD